MQDGLSCVVDALPGLVWAASPDGHTDFTNKRWREYTGLSFDEACGDGWLAAIHPEDSRGFVKRWTEIVASGEPGQADARMRRFDGVYRWFNFSAAPLVDASRTIVRWCGINTDIEDRKQAEDAIRQEEGRFHAIVDGLPAVVVLMKPDGQFEHANHHMLDYLGATLDELKARAFDFNWRFSFHPDDRDGILARWKQSIETGAPYDGEGRLRRADGVYRWFQIRGYPLRDAQGRIVVWYLLQTDIDDRKRAERLLAGERRLLELVAKGEPLSAALTELCLLVEDLCAGCISCSILLLDPETDRLWHAASPNVPEAYTAAIDGFAIGPDVSACGAAAYGHSQVITSDIASDPNWEAFRGVALSSGLKACWSTPIFSQQGRVLGTFAMFSGEPAKPTAYDQEVIAQITHLASIAIERERSQASLKQALDDLRGSESRLRTIIDTIPASVWCSRPDGSGEFWNQRWHDYAGVLSAVAQASERYAITHPDDLEKVAAAWNTAIGSGQAGEVEARLRRFDGVYRWFLCRFEPLRNAAGTIVNWYGANTDIDDAKRAEALLAEEKRLLEMVASGHSLEVVLDALCELVEATADGAYCAVVLVDSHGTHLKHGAAPNLPTGYREAIIGRPVNSESGPCAMAVHLNQQVLAEDIPSETRWMDYDWPPLALAHGLKACWSTPITSAGGHPIGAFAIYYAEPMRPTPQHQLLIARFTHIASIAIERVQKDVALRRSEAFLAQAQHLSSTCSFSWRVPTEEISWSQEAYRIFEFDPTKPVTNELIYSRIHPDDAPALFDFMDQARRGELVDFKYDHRLLMPTGEVKYITMVAHGNRGQDGHLEYIAAVQDVTQRRVSEEAVGAVRAELARVARVASMGALTASIAHEVNQPLSGIITNASTCLRMLAADPPNVAGARETARRTIRDGNRAADVITRLRALFAKKEAAIEAVDLNDAAGEVLALLTGELRRARVVLKTQFAADLPPVIGDRVQLQQVVLNLLLNAADALGGVQDRPREITVRTEKDDAYHVHLAVKDLGAGLQVGVSDRLFEPFYTTKSGGMGIGLSISRSIIESHKGRLWASPNDGPGATFSFSIPSSDTSIQPIKPSTEQRLGRFDRSSSILANVGS